MAISYNRQLTFGMWKLQELLDPSHHLIKLAELIDWEAIHDQLKCYYSKTGKQGASIRLMVGLHILKHMENMSDAKCTDRIRSDLYWMYFCGVDADTLKNKYSHLNSATMTKFRKRIGDKGFAEIEKVITQYLVQNQYIDPKVMNIDSTCMEKNVEYPTDSSLLDRGRKKIIKLIRKLQDTGVKGAENLRTFSRKSKKIILGMSKFSKDKAEKIKEGTIELSQQTVHAINKGKEILESAKKYGKKLGSGMSKALELDQLSFQLKKQLEVVEKIVSQARLRFQGIHISNKIYSLEQPHVICIRKGKKKKPNEYGTILNIATDKHGFIVNHESYASNESDANLLKPSIKNWKETTGVLPHQSNGDRGYAQKKKNITGDLKKVRLCIPKKGKKKHPDAEKSWFKKGQRQRSQIEGVFAHLKNNHRLDKSRYHGFQGDKINATLGCMAWNLNKLARMAS